jgi:hypothetical protein
MKYPTGTYKKLSNIQAERVAARSAKATMVMSAAVPPMINSNRP